MRTSARFEGRRFENALAVEEDLGRIIRKWIRGGSPHREPEHRLPVIDSLASQGISAPSEDLRVTWLGHSTTLIEIDGHRILTDPIWSDRASPSQTLGSKRFFDPPIALEALPDLDAVIISHDHYDHLDRETISRLANEQVTFVVPLGVGSHLEYWGVEASRIHELDWWQSKNIGSLTLVATPARHFSGRGLTDRNATLWAGWALLGPRHRVYFSGDTGFFPGFAEIGARLGPFDLSMIEIGAYDETWADVHLGPEQAMEAHRAVGADVMMPIHWGTFNLALHGWTEPVERLLVAANTTDEVLWIPRPGESFEPVHGPRTEKWWPELAWQSASEHPVRSSKRPTPAGSISPAMALADR